MSDVLRQFNEEIERADNTPARSLERRDAAISGLACEVRQLRNELALANVQLHDLRKENSELKVRDSNVTFHSRNVMAVNEALRKRIAALEGGIVAENRRVTELVVFLETRIAALSEAGNALKVRLLETTLLNVDEQAIDSWENTRG